MGKTLAEKKIFELVEILRIVCLENDNYEGTSVLGHLIDTGKIATMVAVEVGADPFICYLGGSSHDIGAITNGRENHHIIGAGLTGRILKYLRDPNKPGELSDELIDAVKGCVLNHRSSVGVAELTLEEKVVRTADALSHYWRVDELWKEGLRRDMAPAHIKTWLTKKFAKDWQKIMPEILVPKVRQQVQGPSPGELYEQALIKLDMLYAESIAAISQDVLLDIAFQLGRVD